MKGKWGIRSAGSGILGKSLKLQKGDTLESSRNGYESSRFVHLSSRNMPETSGFLQQSSRKHSKSSQLTKFTKTPTKKEGRTSLHEVRPSPFIYSDALKMASTSSLFSLLKFPNSPFTIALSAIRSIWLSSMS